MHSHAEPAARRIARLKQAQQQMQLASAQRQQRQAQAKRADAEQLRASAAQTVAGAQLQPEQDITRQGLYDRLRVLAVARAHAQESTLAAGQLDSEAAECEAAEQQLRVSAQAHQRKQAKLVQWGMRQRRQALRQQDRQQQQQQIEEILCHRLYPR